MRTKVLSGLLLVSTMAVLLLVDPAQSWWMPKCPFRLLTGLSCPGCGVQRAAHALFHGDVWGALRFNWFLLLAGPYLLGLVAERFFLHGTVQVRLRRVLEHKYVVWFYVVCYVVWLVVRNILGI